MIGLCVLGSFEEIYRMPSLMDSREVLLIAILMCGIDLEVGSSLLVQQHKVYPLLCAKGNDKHHNHTCDNNCRNHTTRDSKSLSQSAGTAPTVLASVTLLAHTIRQIVVLYVDCCILIRIKLERCRVIDAQ